MFFWVEVPLQPPIIHHFAIFCRAYPLHCLEPFVLRQLVAAVIIQLLPGERQFLAKGVDQELHEFLAQKKAGFAKRSQNEWRWSNDPMDEEEWVGDPWYTFIYFQHLYIPKGNEIKSNRLIISLLNSSGRLERLWLLQLPIRIPMCKNCGLWSASTWETVAVQRLSVRRLDYHVFARIPRIHTPSEPECWEQTSWPGSLLWDKEGCYCCNCTTLGIHKLGKHKRTHTIYLLPITILATICCNGSYMFLSWKAKSCVCVCVEQTWPSKASQTSRFHIGFYVCSTAEPFLFPTFCRSDICEIKWAGGQTEKSFKPLTSYFPFDSSKHQLFSHVQFCRMLNL